MKPFVLCSYNALLMESDNLLGQENKTSIFPKLHHVIKSQPTHNVFFIVWLYKQGFTGMYLVNMKIPTFYQDRSLRDSSIYVCVGNEFAVSSYELKMVCNRLLLLPFIDRFFLCMEMGNRPKGPLLVDVLQ